MNLVVRVLAPTGRDAELITTVLKQKGISAVQATPSTLCATGNGEDSLGPLLITEEALSPGVIQHLSTVLRHQPTWSDLPILILTSSGRETTESYLLERERLPLGSPVLLERPIRTATLVSSVMAAVRARVRQYQMRDTLAQLKQERESLQVVLDNLPVGVIMAKSDGEVVLGNRSLETILRHPLIPTPDLASYRQWRLLAEDGAPLRPEDYPLARAMKAGRPLAPEEFLYERGDGSRAWLRLAASPILNDHGQVLGGVVAVSDIDHQKRSELALIQNEKLAAVGRLAASISHEINNPLEAVTNLVYLARFSDGLPEQSGQYLEAAERELSRVSQIVSHTLRFHRQSTKPSRVTAQELLAPTLGIFAGRLLNAHITVQVEHLSKSSVSCYEGEIRQVLNNLVGNAIEAMRNGGRLCVRTRDIHNGIRITIADTGHGMTPSVRDRLFEAFYTTKGMNGTGLGLWISKSIVDKHRGRLQVRSSTSSPTGTVFSLVLQAQPF